MCVVCACSSVTALTRRTVLSSLHSLEVSPQVETSSDAPSHSAPCSPARCPAALPASMPSSNLPAAPGDSQAGCLSPTNPFLNSLQSNPFFEELLADQVLNSPSPTHFLSSFPPGPRAAPEVAGSFYSSEDCSPSASPRQADPEGESPAQSVGVPVPETTPPAPGELPPADTDPAIPPLPSEWDDTFDAFATSRLKPERKKENLFSSVAAEGMAFIDEPDRASPTESSAEPPFQKGSKAFEKAESPIGAEIPAALRSWTNFSTLDVGANLVSTTQEATVIEDVLSPVSAGSMAGRRKSSTPTVWTAAFASGNPGDKEASTAPSTENSTREEGDSGEEDSCRAGTNGWMTIATETAADPSESAPEEHEGTFGLRPPFLAEGAFEAQSSSRATSRVLPRSSFPSEALPGSTVAAVPPRVLGDVAGPGGGQEGTLDIRSSVFRLQASMRLQASDGLLTLSSDIRERHLVLSPWAAPQGHQEPVPGPPVPPPKPPRWFAAAGAVGDSEEGEPGGTQRGKQEQEEESEGPGAEMELPRSRGSSEPSVPAPPSLSTPGAGTAEAMSEFPAPKGARAAAVDSAAALEPGNSELGTGDTSVGEHPAEMNETDVAEQFESCISKFSLDGLDQSGAEESWSQPRLSPQTQGAADSAKWERASKQELFPEELSISGLKPPPKLDLSQLASWTALEEQEAAGQPQPQRSERGESPSQLELACQDGEGRAGEQPQPCAPPEEAEQGRASEEPQGHSAESRIDFKKADFWKPDRAEERHTQAAPVLRNPFTLALSPTSPSNPFMEKPPAPLPVQAVLPEKLEQGDFSFLSLQEEAPGHGLQPTNATPLHASQPLAFSTPFPVAATNPEPCGRPRSPAGVPARRAAARPRPQPGDAQASALPVLPRETRPAEKPLCQQTSR